MFLSSNEWLDVGLLKKSYLAQNSQMYIYDIIYLFIKRKHKIKHFKILLKKNLFHITEN